MNRIAVSLAALGMGLGFAQGAQAVIVPLPDAGATIVSSPCGRAGCFWSLARGDMVQQNIDGSGLASINVLDLFPYISRNSLSAGNQVNWEVALNGTVVGSFSMFAATPSGTFSTSFSSFGTISGVDLGLGTPGSDDYTLLMRVTNEVPQGGGSVQLSFGPDGEAELRFQQAPGIPEPASIALVGLGLLGLGLTRRRFV